MECLHCKGQMVRAETPYSVSRRGYHVSWDAVPAWVCTQCGEPYFEAEAINHMQSALEKLDRETQFLAGKTA